MKPYVEFPYLNLKLNIDRVAFSIFGIDIYWYGLIIATGLILGALLASKIAQKKGLKSDNILDVVIIGLPVCVICARLYYVAFEWEKYSGNIAEIFNIRNGGIAIYGAIIGGFVTGAVYCKVKKISFLKLADAASFGLLTGQIIGRWGNFFNQEAYGSNTALPWGMTGSRIISDLQKMQANGIDINPEIPVHPTFLYESLWNLCVLGVIYYIFKNKHKFDGIEFFTYISLYGVGRFFIEGLRTDSLMFMGLRVSQIVALVCFAFGFGMIIYKSVTIKKLA